MHSKATRLVAYSDGLMGDLLLKYGVVYLLEHCGRRRLCLRNEERGL